MRANGFVLLLGIERIYLPLVWRSCSSDTQQAMVMWWHAKVGVKRLVLMSCVAETITIVHRLVELRAFQSFLNMLVLPPLLTLMIPLRSCMSALRHVNLKLFSVIRVIQKDEEENE